MASAHGMGEESFLSYVERVRSEIRTKFIRAHELLQDREADLLAELQRLVDEFKSRSVVDQIKQLTDSKSSLLATLKGNENKEILDLSLSPINARIAELEINLLKDTYHSVSLEWDVELDKKLSVAGNIRLNAMKHRTRDYKKLGDPALVFWKYSCSPDGLVINPVDNNIYICDYGNNRVQVFNSLLKFLFLFNDNMAGPSGICIKLDKVYVTQCDTNCLNVYSTEGKYLTSVGRMGKKKLKFNKPRGLDVSIEQNIITIAEYDNDRIQCLHLDLKFHSFIDNVFAPLDIKLTPGEIVVLSSRSPCVSIYTHSHQCIRQMIPCGKNKLVVCPIRFVLTELSKTILITDLEGNCVCVFSFTGGLLHRFGEYINPKGVAIDKQGKILIATENPGQCIQTFQSQYY